MVREKKKHSVYYTFILGYFFAINSEHLIQGINFPEISFFEKKKKWKLYFQKKVFAKSSNIITKMTHITTKTLAKMCYLYFCIKTKNTSITKFLRFPSSRQKRYSKLVTIMTINLHYWRSKRHWLKHTNA